MKKILIVLFGALVFQGSVWAQFDGWSTSCLEASAGDTGSFGIAEILHPASAGLVLKKNAPFLLQWKDMSDARERDKSHVKIRLYEKGAEGKDLFKKILNNRPNTGTALITKQNLKRAKVKAGEKYFFQVQLNYGSRKTKISSECFTFNVKEKEDFQCDNASTLKSCVKALVIDNRSLRAEVASLTDRLDALDGRGMAGSGNALDNDAEKPVCDGSDPDRFNKVDCKNKRWYAANGDSVEDNPVCWKQGAAFNTDNPWVVGVTVSRDHEFKDIRRECALNATCFKDGWWDTVQGENVKQLYEQTRGREYADNNPLGLVIRPRNTIVCQ